MAAIEALLEIMARLRDPEGGCPWDLQQDFETISPHTIEEAYEVDDAIARGDLEGLRDELGDLLFQVVFQARIAEERGAFDFDGVVEAIVDKLVRRHPHVFAADETPQTAAAQSASWEAIKAAERAAAGGHGGGGSSEPDPFEGVPRSLPALARSAKLAGRIRRLGAGTLSPTSDPVVRSEGDGDGEAAAPPATLAAPPAAAPAAFAEAVAALARVEDELAAGGSSGAVDREGALDAVGAGLQRWVAIARRLGVDPEQALRRADDRRVEAIRARLGSHATATPAHQAGSSTHR